jgi:hypothetical protein
MSTEQPESPFESIDAEPGDSSITSGGVVRRLFDGDASGPSLEQLRSDYNLSLHWGLFTRGTIRTASGSGIPPIAEIIMGGILGTVKAIKYREGIDREPQGETVEED